MLVMMCKLNLADAISAMLSVKSEREEGRAITAQIENRFGRQEIGKHQVYQ